MKGESMENSEIAKERVRSLLREGRGWDAIQAAIEANIVDNTLASDALDATSMSLAFARQRNNPEEIQKIEEEIHRIEEWQSQRSD